MHLYEVNRHNSEHPPITTSVDEDARTKANHTITVTTYEFPCGGPCGQTFNTPDGDHWTICGYGTDITLAAWDVASQIKNNPSDALESTYPTAYDAIVNDGASLAFTISYIANIILGNRSVDEGCGRGYYSCNSDSEDLHSVRTCTEQRTRVDGKGNVTTGTCNDQFRRCIGHSIDHNPTDGDDTETPHIGLLPVNGSYTASAGDTHEAKLVTSEAYYYVYWYVASPSDSGLGTLVETDEGYSTGTETEASLSYTFASDAVSGAWTITAVSKRYSDLSQGSTRSYTVTVSSSSTGGSNSITYACGVHSGPASEASSHAMQATCSLTNANGDSCAATGFYACQTHTCQFPDPNLCPAAGCNVRINTNNAADHALVTCTGNVGKSCRQQYYACQANDHRWVRCQRGVSCPSYALGNSFPRSAYMTRACMPNPNTCITVNGVRQKHLLQ